MQGKPDYSGLCNVGECMSEDLRRAGDYAFAGGMSQLVDAVRNQAARLEAYEAALKYIWDRCGPHDQIPPCLDAAERARKALEGK